MTRWFGPYGPWAAVCDDAERMPTPVGAPCLYCAEPIAADDEGLVQLCVRGAGRFDFEERACHRECVLRQTIGGVHHQQRTCSCYGGTDAADPPGLTRREAARAAVAAWEAGSARARA